jgi:adenosylhomocysteine nucleosidase
MATELISAAPAITVPCIVFALRRESMYFRRAYPFRRRISGAPCRAEKRWQRPFSPETVPDTFFLMLEAGVGSAAMEAALHWCLSGPRFGAMPYRPRLLISAGFSGALQPGLHAGDLVLATEVIDQNGSSWPAIRPAALAGCDIAAGRLLTTPEIVGDPSEKQRLGRQYEALAVDMESAIAARFCREHDVPFACLRVISDDWRTALSPHLVELLRQGRVSLPRVAVQVLRHPGLLGELGRLARQTRQASRKLMGALSTVITSGQRTRAGE